ncbi:hypothetical protein IAE35_17905 [Pseudomonas sp. S75]|nr:hypothetical protein [Pseudomonas sp. S75]MBK0155221.1 hypothetical protein [Pseudomonas sp. S75]
MSVLMDPLIEGVNEKGVPIIAGLGGPSLDDGRRDGRYAVREGRFRIFSD